MYRCAKASGRECLPAAVDGRLAKCETDFVSAPLSFVLENTAGFSGLSLSSAGVPAGRDTSCPAASNIVMVAAIVQQRGKNAELRQRIVALSRTSGNSVAPDAGLDSGQKPSVAVTNESVSANERGELARLRAEMNLLKIPTPELAIAVNCNGSGSPG